MPERPDAGKWRRGGAPGRAASAALASGLVAAALACGETAPDAPAPAPVEPAAPEPPAEFVATSRDFADFASWQRIALDDPTLPTKARPGAAAVYLSCPMPEPGARAWPVGTILVKTVEPADDPRDWTVHAMVKRGGDFNRRAYGWEFFGLQLTADGRPVILWRTEGDNDGHSYSAGLSFAARLGGDPGAERSCVDCHSVGWQDDYVLTPSLSIHAARLRARAARPE